MKQMNQNQWLILQKRLSKIFSIIKLSIEYLFLSSHTWYQSESSVFVVIPIRNVQRDQVHVESTENTVRWSLLLIIE